MTERVIIDATLEQADALVAATDLLVRINLGQIDEIANLARMSRISARAPVDGKGRPLTLDEIDQIEDLANAIKCVLGHPINGSFGIGHSALSKEAHRAYELQKVVQKAVADHRRRDQSKGTNTAHDGLIVRYTDDPAPKARVELSSPSSPAIPNNRIDQAARAIADARGWFWTGLTPEQRTSLRHDAKAVLSIPEAF